MLTKADDYPIHQLPEPIATAGTDRNFYDRYFFNGYTMDGAHFFAVAMGIYPHLNVIDAAFSVVQDGKQHNLRASRILGSERMDTRVGPISIEVVEPLKTLRVRVADNEHSISADLTFRARAPAIEEPRFVYRSGPRTIMDYTRLTQNGTYEGFFSVGGKRIAVDATMFQGTRDRSWGVRPIGAPDSQPVAPPPRPQFYWLWGPANFSDRITLYHINADATGKPWNTAAVMAMTGADGAITHFTSCRSDVVFKSGTRHAKSATVHLTDAKGEVWRLEYTPKWDFSMSGIGYTHPQWGHGHYKGPEAVGYDVYDFGTRNEKDFLHLHVQAFSTVRLFGPNDFMRPGAGILEQLIIGAHAPSGFKDLMDFAP